MILYIDQMETFDEVYCFLNFPPKNTHRIFSFSNCAQIFLQQNIQNQYNMTQILKSLQEGI